MHLSHNTQPIKHQLGVGIALTARECRIVRRRSLIAVQAALGRLVAGLAFEALGAEPHAIFVRSGHALMKKGAHKLAGIVSQTWVLPPQGNVLRDRLTVLFMQKGIELAQQVVEASALRVITSVLRASDMVAPLPIEVVRPCLDTGGLEKLPVRFGLRLGVTGIVPRKGAELIARRALDIGGTEGGG
ncbi:MAG: LysR substrate-binding domain-containing protein [Betaproteobacteria bacterium]